MSYSKTGDWAKVTKLIGALSSEMEHARSVSLKQWGLKAEGTAKKHMRSQDLGWEGLQAATLANKIRKGLSEHVLVATSSYFQSITSWKKGGIVYAGVKRSVKNSEGDEIADIAKIHEYGATAANIPARPLWHPTYRETMKWYRTSKYRATKIFKDRMKRYT